MLNFDPNFQNFPSNRYTLASNKGMVATSSALAAEAGAKILRLGGNAVDAAIATAAALTVVEPSANGIGSDNFAIVWMKGKLDGMSSQGYSPASISLDAVKEKYSEMPKYGWTPVTVSGAPAGWAALSEKYGNLSLADCLKPAVDLARDGFPVAATVAVAWKRAAKKFESQLEAHPEIQSWFDCFTKDGRTPDPFEMWTLPDHATTLEKIGQTQAKAFYEGDLAEKIAQQSQADGGYLSLEDLKNHKPLFVTPIKTNYRGYDIYELPPSNQGLVALMGLNILENWTFHERNTDYYHKAFEAMKLAFADGKTYITDPDCMSVPFESLLKKSYGQERAALITDQAQDFDAGKPLGNNTVYLATGDKDGNLVSFIQSNYMGFGSGVVIKGTGISLQNRGADFSLDPNHDNVLAGKKKTYHTIIPGMMGKDGEAFAAFGVMGGYMQPQGHLQVASNLIDFGDNPQMALDAPRWQWMQGKEFLVENHFPRAIAEVLSLKGHQVTKAVDFTPFGRGQIVMRGKDGVLLGATESRTDGNIALC